MQELEKLIMEREANPIKCEVCSIKIGRDIFFENLSWYHCPICGKHGFASIYINSCTDCANKKRSVSFPTDLLTEV